MPSSRTLGAGAPLYHPETPVGFHPALHAAAHLLDACLEVDPKVIDDFKKALVTGPKLIPPHRVEPAITEWAESRHLVSPYVLEVLALTRAAWCSALKRLTLLDVDSAQLSHDVPSDQVARIEQRCHDALTGWGPWVRLLTGDPQAIQQLDILIDLAVPLNHLLLPRAKATFLLEQPTLDLQGWNPELETWQEAQLRLRETFESFLRAHRACVEEACEAAGLRPTPVKTNLDHFLWLAQRQLRGDRPSEVARQAGAGVSTVHAAYTQLTDLLDLELRRVRAGPSSW